LNVLVIGSGGREHALAYGISLSKKLSKLYAAPGNPGTASIAENVNLISHSEIIDFCKSNNIELVVIGPEKPLVEGLADKLRENGLIVFGPGKEAADIEASKSFAKQIMQKYNIPTAEYIEFSSAQSEEAKEYLEKSEYPLVIKADGLAAGKGVLICKDNKDAAEALDEIFQKKAFGKAGDKIIIEKFLRGEEASIFAVTDGTDFVCLPSAQDHKRAYNGDKGKNTGGMGAYVPAPVVTPDVLNKVEEQIIRPALEAMRKEGREFIGCLYCGLMIEKGEPKVVEFNCRFGDPETQAVIPVLEGDLLELLYSAAKGKINKNAVRYSGNSAVSVVAASYGYPDYYETGFEIEGLEKMNYDDVIVFHAGTKMEKGRVITSGGRVFALTAVAGKKELRKAKEKAYDYLRELHFENIYYRTDISDKAFKKF
jgi:phosphoribosylamine---glycine ligase